jgi:glycosyltransferase involved in cell wall biosynthesis
MYALKPTNVFARALEETFNQTLLGRQLSKSSAVIGLTPKITAYARRYGSSRSRYFTIPNGVETRIFRDNLKNREYYREKYAIPKRKVVVLFRGRFSQVKGVLELAQAAENFVQQNNDAFFLFVGGGPLYEKLKTRLKSIERSSKILSWTPISTLHELYIASDIFVLPSKWEALPITLIEAMASHLCIVATPVGGIPEVLKDYPWKTYIGGFSSNHIFIALANAWRNLSTLKKAEVDIGKYDWDNICSRTITVYKEIIGQCSRQPPIR